MTLTRHEQAIYNKGARKAISLILAHVRRKAVCSFDRSTFQRWLLDMDIRYQKRPRGIGRAKSTKG